MDAEMEDDDADDADGANDANSFLISAEEVLSHGYVKLVAHSHGSTQAHVVRLWRFLQHCQDPPPVVTSIGQYVVASRVGSD